jgi:hypothetical protein
MTPFSIDLFGVIIVVGLIVLAGIVYHYKKIKLKSAAATLKATRSAGDQVAATLTQSLSNVNKSLKNMPPSTATPLTEPA